MTLLDIGATLKKIKQSKKVIWNYLHNSGFYASIDGWFVLLQLILIFLGQKQHKGNNAKLFSSMLHSLLITVCIADLKYEILKMLGLYLYTLKISHKSCSK